MQISTMTDENAQFVDKTTFKLRRKGLFCKADLVKLKTSFIQANKLRWKVYCVEDEKLGTFNNSQF